MKLRMQNLEIALYEFQGQLTIDASSLDVSELVALIELRRKRNEKLYEKSKELANESVGANKKEELDKYDKMAMEQLGRKLTVQEKRLYAAREQMQQLSQ